MNFIPQVETQEISDSDLDNVSGGLGGFATVSLDPILPVSATVGGGVALGSPVGLTAVVTAPGTALVAGL